MILLFFLYIVVLGVVNFMSNSKTAGFKVVSVMYFFHTICAIGSFFAGYRNPIIGWLYITIVFVLLGSIGVYRYNKENLDDPITVDMIKKSVHLYLVKRPSVMLFALFFGIIGLSGFIIMQLHYDACAENYLLFAEEHYKDGIERLSKDKPSSEDIHEATIDFFKFAPRLDGKYIYDSEPIDKRVRKIISEKYPDGEVLYYYSKALEQYNENSVDRSVFYLDKIPDYYTGELSDKVKHFKDVVTKK